MDRAQIEKVSPVLSLLSFVAIVAGWTLIVPPLHSLADAGGGLLHICVDVPARNPQGASTPPPTVWQNCFS